MIKAIAGAALLSVSPSAQAAATSIDQAQALYDVCVQSSDTASSICETYIRGVLHGMSAGNVYDWFCLPSQVAGKELKSKVVRFLADHPEQRKRASASAITAALTAYFPCPPSSRFKR